MEEESPNGEYDMMNVTRTSTAPTNDYYRDNPMYGALKDTLRIGFININGLPANNAHEKNEQIRNAINKNKLDIKIMQYVQQLNIGFLIYIFLCFNKCGGNVMYHILSFCNICC